VNKIELTEAEIERYSRQIILPQVGAEGMMRLKNARVTVIGAGGLGCPAVQILASAGVGFIRIIDGDLVDLSNLPRQILHFSKDVGQPKVFSIREKVLQLNPEVQLEAVNAFLTEDNAEGYFKNSHFIIDATDNFTSKYLINDTCNKLKIPFVIGGVVEFMGQLLSVIPGESACYKCIFPNSEENYSTSCSGAGVMNMIPAFAGLLQATEAIKFLLGHPLSFRNRLFIFDLMMGTFEYIDIKKSNCCSSCK
jgi:molybdopterin/thiamine biosynthesis adenylyltransferase